MLQRREAVRAKAESAKSALPPGSPQEDVDKAAAALKSAENDVIVFTIQLGRAQRMAGEYKASFDTLSPLLAKNENIIDAQVEICETFWDWAVSGGDLKKFILLRNGIRAGKIWGLAPMRQRLARYVKPPVGGVEAEAAKRARENLREKFFEADFKLSKSLLLHSQAVTGAEKTRYLKQAEQLITIFYSLYGDELEKEKGKEQDLYNDYDTLLKDIQRALNQNATGLQALPRKNRPAESSKPKSSAAAAVGAGQTK
jgi:hypothetical protein